ncbi:MAG TPA: glutaminyl-peptide cyclotransferase [Methanothrix sp.]|nr:glutaminyl-peptide cyclotransferase [Methanothrix sp.]
MLKINAPARTHALTSAFILFALLIPAAAHLLSPAAGITDMPAVNEGVDSSSIPFLEYEIINVYPHSGRAFTQGLVYENGTLYEGTGRYGQSSLSRVSLQTGRVLQQVSLERDLFGEGVAIWGDRIIQLTWKSGLALVYGRDNFTRIGSFTYATEGWGLTADNNSLIMSDGSDTLHILDPESYAERGHINVTAFGRPLLLLNELEYIKGKIYANIWKSDRIAVISPQSGEVQGIIDLRGILETQNISANQADVLNGIAYDAENDTIFITGKLWPRLFEIKVQEPGEMLQ